MLVSALYEPMRLLLGDEQIAGAWGYEDDMIAAYIRQPFMLGMAPPFLELTTVTTANDTIDPDPNPTEQGLILLHAAKCFFSTQKAVSWRTRAASYSEGQSAVRDIVRNLTEKIQALEEDGGLRDEQGVVTGTPIFGASGDLSTWTTSFAQVLYGSRTFL